MSVGSGRPAACRALAFHALGAPTFEEVEQIARWTYGRGERDYEVFYMGRANYLKSHAHLRLGSTVRNTASGPTRIHRREATRRGISGVRASR